LHLDHILIVLAVPITTAKFDLMPRKFLKRFMPSHTRVKEHKHLQIFGDVLHEPNLWHINRRSMAGGFAVGLFFAWVPVPLQMLLAAAAAILLRTNLALSVTLVWITNPVTIPPMFYFAYLVGTWVIGTPAQQFEFELSFDWLTSELSSSWKPFLTGCFILATASSIIGYLTISQLWVYNVRRQRSKRMDKTL
jgi:uncharacterized protein (DUF2062 family)